MPTWMTKPEMIVTFVLFGLSVAISLWANEIRRFLSSKVRGMKSSRLQEYEYKLKFLEWINGNTHNLLLWAIQNTLAVLHYTIWLTIGACLLVIIANAFSPARLKVSDFVRMLVPILPGYFIGRVISMHHTIRQLYSYEISTAELRDAIAKLKAELASAQADK